jgi:serine/threonine protein kinase
MYFSIFIIVIRFDLVRKLGQGTFGKVQLGVNKETGQEVAIKTIKKAKIETEADLIRIRREIQIMSSVRHPNIIHIYEGKSNLRRQYCKPFYLICLRIIVTVFENKEKMVLVMEYAAGGELYDYLSQRKVLSETEARRIFRQVASAVYYCHKVGFIFISFDCSRYVIQMLIFNLSIKFAIEISNWKTFCWTKPKAQKSVLSHVQIK